METLGALMMAAPFVAFFVLMAYASGVRVACAVFAGTAAIAGWICAAAWLMDGAK